jgi:oligosaccharide reducing-end xylanase
VTPFFYELYANNSRGDFWRGAAAAGRSFFHAAADSRTALTPDYATFGGQPTGSGKTFSFDAWRTARNVAIDYAWFAADPWGVEFCNRLLGFFRGLPTWPSYGNQFSLDGKQTGGDHSPGECCVHEKMLRAEGTRSF